MINPLNSHANASPTKRGAPTTATACRGRTASGVGLYRDLCRQGFATHLGARERCGLFGGPAAPKGFAIRPRAASRPRHPCCSRGEQGALDARKASWTSSKALDRLMHKRNDLVE